MSVYRSYKVIPSVDLHASYGLMFVLGGIMGVIALSDPIPWWSLVFIFPVMILVAVLTGGRSKDILIRKSDSDLDILNDFTKIEI